MSANESKGTVSYNFVFKNLNMQRKPNIPELWPKNRVLN